MVVALFGGGLIEVEPRQGTETMKMPKMSKEVKKKLAWLKKFEQEVLGKNEHPMSWHVHLGVDVIVQAVDATEAELLAVQEMKRLMTATLCVVRVDGSPQRRALQGQGFRIVSAEGLVGA